ncbi:MAG: iron donor protein CyaY [Janthinobacterium lividum]
MNEIEFRHQVCKALQFLEEHLEQQLDHQADIDAREESLQITLSSGQIWLLNRHTPSREIWLSSPIQGGIHFGWCVQKKRWISTRSFQDELFDFLEKDLSSVLGFAVQLQKIQA